MRKPVFAYAKTKAQITCAVTARLVSAFVFAAKIMQSLFFLKSLVIFCGCTAKSVSDLAGHPGDRFSRDAAQSMSAD